MSPFCFFEKDLFVSKKTPPPQGEGKTSQFNNYLPINQAADRGSLIKKYFFGLDFDINERLECRK